MGIPMKAGKMQINSLENVPDLITLSERKILTQLVFAVMNSLSSILFGFHTYFSLSMHVTHFMLVDESPESILVGLGERHGNEASARLPPATPGGRGPP